MGGVVGGALSGDNLPLFGDTDGNGILSGAEDSALSVTLNLDGDTVDTQIGHVADLAQQLADAGIDYIGVNASDAGEITITDDQASLLVGAGLAFADAGNIGETPDNVTMGVEASGTHLKTSLQDLQKLGVDTVLVTGSDSVTVDLGGVGEGVGGPVGDCWSVVKTGDDNRAGRVIGRECGGPAGAGRRGVAWRGVGRSGTAALVPSLIGEGGRFTIGTRDVADLGCRGDQQRVGAGDATTCKGFGGIRQFVVACKCGDV